MDITTYIDGLQTASNHRQKIIDCWCSHSWKG